MALTAEEEATLRTRLSEAQAALHSLVTGAKLVEVLVDGQTAKYTAATQGSLRVYIASLKKQLGDDTRPRRPLTVMF